MANYEVSPELLLPYLPHGVELDDFQGKTYLSLVAFMFKKTRLFGLPIPFLGTFEEVNLRFYVKRTIQGRTQRGVVFINETVPYKLVALLANILYKEHYTAIPTRSKIHANEFEKKIDYQWKVNKRWNQLSLTTDNNPTQMKAHSIEDFIFEHYFGYTKINHNTSQEYKINHPRWLINKVIEFNLQCDFESMYGADFGFLTHAQPQSVIFAQGSPVSVNWLRTRFS